MANTLISMSVGFLLGWLLFQRPKFFTDLLDKAKAKIGIAG